MTALTLAVAQKIAANTLAASRERKLNPMAVAVLDARGAPVVVLCEDGSSLMRWKIAFAKANGALSLGVGSRRIGAMAAERPQFISAAAELAVGGLIPGAGGVLIRDAAGMVVGAVGVSGDTSDNDEAVAMGAIGAAGLAADGG